MLFSGLQSPIPGSIETLVLFLTAQLRTTSPGTLKFCWSRCEYRNRGRSVEARWDSAVTLDSVWLATQALRYRGCPSKFWIVRLAGMGVEELPT